MYANCYFQNHDHKVQYPLAVLRVRVNKIPAIDFSPPQLAEKCYIITGYKLVDGDFMSHTKG